jgi:hypothetical protein
VLAVAGVNSKIKTEWESAAAVLLALATLITNFSD